MFTPRDRDAIRAWARRKGYAPEAFLAECEAREEATHMFTCPRCGMTSFNQNDALAGYCGNCHDFTVGRVGETERARVARLDAFERSVRTFGTLRDRFDQLRQALDANVITAQQFSAAIGQLANLERDANARAIGISSRIAEGTGYPRVREESIETYRAAFGDAPPPEENFVRTVSTERAGDAVPPLTLDTLRAAMADMRRTDDFFTEFMRTPIQRPVAGPPIPASPPQSVPRESATEAWLRREAFERDLMGSDRLDALAYGALIGNPDLDPTPVAPPARPQTLPPEPTRRKIVL